MGFLRCCVYYGILAVVSFFIGRLLPKSWFHGDRFPYRCASWEAKLFRFLRVHEWQDKVPDMSKIVPKLIPAVSHHPALQPAAAAKASRRAAAPEQTQPRRTTVKDRIFS